MKAKVLSVLASVTLFAAVPPASAANLITFDDLSNPSSPLDGDAIQNGYANLNWSNFLVLDAVNFGNNPSGYFTGMISSPNVATNGFGNPASLSSLSGSFTLNSFYLTAAWNDGLNVTIQGLSGANVVDSLSTTVDGTGPGTLFTLNWSNIDRVTFASSGGDSHPGFCCGGTEAASVNFVLDNVTVDFSGVPGPIAGAGLPGLIATFGALVALARRRRKLVA